MGPCNRQPNVNRFTRTVKLTVVSIGWNHPTFSRFCGLIIRRSRGWAEAKKNADWCCPAAGSDIPIAEPFVSLQSDRRLLA